MSEPTTPPRDPAEYMFWMMADTIREGGYRGVQWKDSAKGILWAADEIKRLRTAEQRSVLPAAGDCGAGKGSV